MKLTPLAKILIVLLVSVLVYLALRAFGVVSPGGSDGSSDAGDPSASTATEAPPDAPTPEPAASAPLLRFAGSNTVGHTLLPLLAEAYLAREGATSVRREPGASHTTIHVTGELEGKRQTIAIQAHGTATGFVALQQGKADVAMASRRIREDEVARLASIGPMTSPSREHVLAVDGVAVIVQADRRLESVTVPQLAGLFSGTLNDFAKLGAGAGAVHVYARDDASGTFETFKSLVLHDQPLSASARRFEDGAELVAAVARDPQGIGFVSASQASGDSGVHTLAVAEPSATALLPTRLTIGTEDYALSRRLFLYVADTGHARARSFVDFALSRAGQELVTKAGFVALTPESTRASAPANALPAYDKVIAGASRLTTNFRFHTGSSELDNRALRDLDRVAELMIDLKRGGEKLLLLGFSDATGAARVNQQLSHDRAEHVARALRQRGLDASRVEGFGAAMPVADNATSEGREKNRRVEIWIAGS